MGDEDNSDEDIGKLNPSHDFYDDKNDEEVVPTTSGSELIDLGS